MWLESTVLRRRRVPSGCVSAAFDRARKDSAGPNHATALSRAYIDLMNVRHARRERRQAAGGGRADTAKKHYFQRVRSVYRTDSRGPGSVEQTQRYPEATPVALEVQQCPRWGGSAA